MRTSLRQDRSAAVSSRSNLHFSAKHAAPLGLEGASGWRTIHMSPLRGWQRPAPRARAPFHDTRAFTLIELVISASLMTLILVSAYLCLSSGLSSRKLIESRAEVVQSARVALAMMSADLRAACAISKDIPFLGMQRKLGEVEADNLDFATHNYTPRRGREGDFCEISYFLGKEPESGQFLLYRRRHPAIAVEPLSGGSREEIARGLRGLKFEYYDGFDWYNQWGDTEGRGKAQNSLRVRPNLEGLPEAVRITLWFEPDAGVTSQAPSNVHTNETSLAFQTVCRLNLAGLSLRSSSSSSSDTSNTPSRPAQVAPEGGRQ